MPNIDFNFADRTVIVTGAGRGIGAAIAARFAAARARVWVVDVDADVARRTAKQLGADWAVCDVSVTREVEEVVASAVRKTGRVDVVVNNAGILRDRMLWKLDDADWDAVLGVHLGGTFRFTRACVPHFRGQEFGRVINVTSYTGLRGNIGQSAYAAAKAGVVGFTKTAAKELARFGITVNAICPNAETRMVESIPEEKLAELTAMIPLGRYAAPREIADGVVFLATEEAGYITGEVLRIDGGLAM